MTARDGFHSMLREHIGPLLRSAGFKASAATWRLRSTNGDFAVVNVQKSRWDTADQVTFYVNLAVVPRLWWEYLSELSNKAPSAPTESYGLLRRRLDPPKDHPLLPQRNWLMHDAQSARNCGTVLGQQLEGAVRELKAMLDRDHLLAFIQDGANGWWLVPRTELAIAYVIADQGLTPHLREVLDTFDAVPQQPRLEQQSAWLRQRASGIQQDG